MSRQPKQSASRSRVGFNALPPTRWSVVKRAGERCGDAWLYDLETIASLYRPVLVRHLVIRMRLQHDRAEDFVQMFLAEKILSQNVIRAASSEKGRFRSFLLKTFSNFVVSQLREQKALKRRPSDPDAIRIDDLPEISSDAATPADTFDILWARQVLARAIERMRNECLTQKRRVLWDLLEARTLGPVLEGSEPVSYDKLVARFALRSPSEASNLLVTAKRMFVRLLQDVVRETVLKSGDVDAELMELQRILST